MQKPAYCTDKYGIHYTETQNTLSTFCRTNILLFTSNAQHGDSAENQPEQN